MFVGTTKQSESETGDRSRGKGSQDGSRIRMQVADCRPEILLFGA
jgi:hypothetical protein